MRISCHTPEQTELYERGYPYMTVLVDGHKDDKKPGASALKVFSEYYGRYHVEWPRLTAHAFVRASAVYDGEWDADDVAVAASRSTEPVGADEAKAILAAILARKAGSDLNEIFHMVFTLEAITGNDVVTGAIVSGLEGLPKARWAGEVDGIPALLAYACGFLLLRSSSAPAFRKRLETLFAATQKGGGEGGEETLRGGLDLALHGTEGAKRTLASSHWQYWYYYLMVDDPAVHLARLADRDKSEWVPEARVVWLAGDEMLPVYTSAKALRQGKRLPHILRDLGMFDHERIVGLMVEMMGVKGAGDAPAEYFRANAKRVRGKLEVLARGGGAAAAKAKSALGVVPSSL